MTNPLLSIITVCYNSADTLEQTIASVAVQESKAYEFIVIDGASSDNSLNIIKSNANVIQHWISEPDSGIYDAMNKGLKLAKGTYVLFLNSDDYLTDSKTISDFETFVEENPELDFISGNIIKIFPDSDETKIKSTELDEHELMKGIGPPHQASFITKSVYEEFGFYDAQLRISADYDLFCKYYLKHRRTKYAYWNRKVAFFRADGASSNHEIGKKELGSLIQKHFGDSTYKKYKFNEGLKKKLRPIMKRLGIWR